MGESSPAFTPDLLYDCCASLCPKCCRGGVLTTGSASPEAQETRRTPAFTLETCLSRGRSLWGWESLGGKRVPFAKSGSRPKRPRPHSCQPLPWSMGWVTSTGFPWESSLSPFPPAALRGGRLDEVHWSFYWDPSPTSPQPSAFTQCWFYNKMGKFFFINKGSLHRN